MKIIVESEGFYLIEISNKKEACKISFSPEKKEIVYHENNSLTQFLKLKEFQFRKLLHNKSPKSFYKDFELNFVLHEGLPDVSFYDRNKITVLDNLNNEFNVSKTNTKTLNIIELFTDGSYNHEKEIGGFAILIKPIGDDYKLFQFKTKRKGNNLIELLAVIKGLEYLQNEEKIRIVTDSQYVIKGITEWLPLWKINQFYTVNGTKAKNIRDWKKADRLIQGKYIEFEWVKAHAEHFENTICDMKAKSIIKNQYK